MDTSSACDKLRNAMISTSGSSKKKRDNNVGPLFYSGTTLHKALTEFESYHTRCCEEELVRYWKESREEGVGILPKIQTADVRSHNRATNRRNQIKYATHAVEEAELHLQLK